MRILVVEDEDYIADLIRMALEQLGNECVLAGDAERADARLDEQSFDAVTLDLGMPGTGGLDWLEKMATKQPELARKTLVITGMPLESESVERLARCGAGVLAKPFTIDRFHDAVRTQLEWRGPASSSTD